MYEPLNERRAGANNQAKYLRGHGRASPVARGKTHTVRKASGEKQQENHPRMTKRTLNLSLQHDICKNVFTVFTQLNAALE